MSTDTDQQVSEEKAESLTESIEREIAPKDQAEQVEEIEEVEELEVPDDPPLEPPPKWDKRYKEVFAKLPDREYQQAMIDLYKDQQGYATQIEQERAMLRRFAEPLQEALGPYQGVIAQSGMTPDNFIRQAAGLVMSLQQNPRDTIVQLAQRAGIDLSQIGQEQPYVDPQVKTLQDQLRQMRTDSRQREERQAQEYVARVKAESEQQLRAFTEAKDDNGDPKHPHLELVEGEMAELIHGREAKRRFDPSLPSMSLEEAYERACKLSNEVAQAEEHRRKVKEAAARAAKAKKEANAAKRVAGKFPGEEPVSEDSIEAEILKNLRKSQAA